MICASCDREMADGGMICRNCSPASRPPSHQTPVASHHALALTVRRMKGLVLASIVFGIFVAPVAIWVATKALHQYAAASPADQAELRQLVLLKRIAVGLLLFWAFFLGAEAAWWYAASSST
jgi:hypothetical protein